MCAPTKEKPSIDESTGVVAANAEYDAAAAEVNEALDATWGEVFTSCCVHTPKEWGFIFIGVCAAVFCLYWFLFSLEVLGSSAKVMTGCKAGSLFGDDSNPVAGVMVGVLVTALLQSSSTTTSIIVSMVGSVITVDQAVYMVMGANIGTTITNTIVSMGQMGNGDELERAFAGATVHDLFNCFTVCILLPLEAATGYLVAITGAMVKNASMSDGDTWDGPIKGLVSPLGDRIIKSNSKIIAAVAEGGTCAEFYPIVCEEGVESQKTCKVALIACVKETNKCPIFFSQDNDQEDEVVAGAVCFVLSIFLLFLCLLGLVAVLKHMLLGASSRIIYKATNINGYASMLIGMGLTVLVQSSSVTTSVLTPLVGIGVVPLQSMYPFTLGANIGTTVTALMASMVSDSILSLQVALCHLMFNITGILIWYPIPFLRNIVLNSARNLGKATRIWRGFPILYIGVVFFLIPVTLLGLSTLFTLGSLAWTVLGTVLTIIVTLVAGWTIYWFRYKDGKAQMAETFARRQRKTEAMQALPDDMAALKRKVNVLMDVTGAKDEETAEDDIAEKDAERHALLTEKPTKDMDEDEEVSELDV